MPLIFCVSKRTKNSKVRLNPQKSRTERKTRSRPLARARRTRTSLPKTQVIQHSELVSNVAFHAPTSFNLLRYQINPGLAATLPWGATICLKFDKYKIHSMRFRYVNRTNATVSGSVAMSFDYDPEDLPPSTFQELCQMEGAAQQTVFENFGVSLDCKKAMSFGPWLYTRSTTQTNVSKYDAAAFYLGAEGVDVSADAVFGELWIDYVLCMASPQPTDSALFSTRGLVLDNCSDLTAWNADTHKDAIIPFVSYDPLDNGLFFPDPNQLASIDGGTDYSALNRWILPGSYVGELSYTIYWGLTIAAPLVFSSADGLEINVYVQFWNPETAAHESLMNNEHLLGGDVLAEITKTEFVATPFYFSISETTQIRVGYNSTESGSAYTSGQLNIIDISLRIRAA